MKNRAIVLFLLFVGIFFYVNKKRGKVDLGQIHDTPLTGKIGDTPILYKKLNMDMYLIAARPSTEDVLEFYHHDDSHGLKYRALRLLGFIAEQDDEEAIELLNNIIATHRLDNYKLKAISAILRIGGEPLDLMLENLFSIENYELQLKGLKFSWMNDNLEDLLIIKKHFLAVMKKHPNWRISKIISNSTLPKVNAAIEILDPKDPVKTEQMLRDMVALKGDRRFPEPAGLPFQWAIKMYFISNPDKTKIYDYYVERKNIMFPICENVTTYCGVGKLTEGVLFYLYQMGYELTELEREWLANNFGGFSGLNLFRSKEEYIKFFEFREKYPFTKKVDYCVG